MRMSNNKYINKTKTNKIKKTNKNKTPFFIFIHTLLRIFLRGSYVASPENKRFSYASLHSAP